ncbi:MAG: Asp-tRNA(Asn)/Glu-tRNA(Gln) amidotransferase subunit GatC [Bacteroidia bacterium]|nr:Asp-tRNA(Asn)/Glu-tRNA(Gln) amidotransferase subunit GatC [Bacteroidia bacterium]
MQITDELLQKLATLSKLEIPDSEMAQLRTDFQGMLDFIGKLREVDTDNVKPLIHLTDEVNRLRPDTPDAPLSQEEVLKNAPDHNENYFRVPKVVKK